MWLYPWRRDGTQQRAGAVVRSVTVVHTKFRFSSPPAADAFRRTRWTFPVPRESMCSQQSVCRGQHHVTSLRMSRGESTLWETRSPGGGKDTIGGYAKQCRGAQASEWHFKPRRSTYSLKNRCPSELGWRGDTLELSCDWLNFSQSFYAGSQPLFGSFLPFGETTWSTVCETLISGFKGNLRLSFPTCIYSTSSGITLQEVHPLTVKRPGVRVN